MKEKLFTIPLNDAFHTEDECPFCYLEREMEHELLDFVLGSASSYMESDVRAKTDAAGFCRMHMKMMYDYGNTLGNAWIFKTHFQKIRKELETEIAHFKPPKISFRERLTKESNQENNISSWISQKESSCYICEQFDERFKRYLDTFFYLYERESEFRSMFKNCKGFCLPHFSALCQAAAPRIKASQQDEFYQTLFSIMNENFSRLEEDVSWLVEKFDYRNIDADWKNSKDALPRVMQKLKGGYPADSVYQQKK